MKLKALYDFLLSYNHLLPLSKHKFLFFFEKFYNGLCRGTVILWYSTSSCDNDGPRPAAAAACMPVFWTKTFALQTKTSFRSLNFLISQKKFKIILSSGGLSYKHTTT